MAYTPYNGNTSCHIIIIIIIVIAFVESVAHNKYKTMQVLLNFMN